MAHCCIALKMLPLQTRSGESYPVDTIRDAQQIFSLRIVRFIREGERKEKVSWRGNRYPSMISINVFLWRTRRLVIWLLGRSMRSRGQRFVGTGGGTSSSSMPHAVPAPASIKVCSIGSLGYQCHQWPAPAGVSSTMRRTVPFYSCKGCPGRRRTVMATRDGMFRNKL